MRGWHQALSRLEAEGRPYVIATVLAAQGSTPREASSKMIVTATSSHDTLGGGQLELLVQTQARALLSDSHAHPQIQHFPLAAAAEQCCGGSVTVLLEPRNTALRHVWVFGAGHVGQRVAALLDDLPLKLHWIDQRDVTALPEFETPLRPEPAGDPVTHVEQIQDADAVLVLTHDHELDYRLIDAVLSNTNCKMIGLIGSTTKWRRFQQRLERAGHDANALARVRCPVGLALGDHKTPMAVAVAIVAQLLEELPEATAETQGLTWRQIKLALVGEPAGSGETATADARNGGEPNAAEGP